MSEAVTSGKVGLYEPINQWFRTQNRNSTGKAEFTCAKTRLSDDLLAH